MTQALTIIGVAGGAVCDKTAGENAREVGRLIAKRGAALVCGGLGGVMQEAARGAYEEGGVTIGILPGSSRNEASKYIKLPVVTGMGHARNVILAHTAQALIAIAGEYGTLSEIAIALKLGKPVACIGRWDAVEGVISAATPKEAIERVFALIK
ncbi:hypothetical protein MNBD_NITROSPINAE03-1190 [hydrothermal vent metagenome]|uniref:TIGR00725 family protein n=1 Tax=hydrothermal vent metagenome TaxID=652676 RepID=A0A3B1CF30_9ZZZZ